MRTKVMVRAAAPPVGADGQGLMWRCSPGTGLPQTGALVNQHNHTYIYEYCMAHIKQKWGGGFRSQGGP